jgi:hypothetical protein
VKPPSPRVTETAAGDPGCAKTPWRPLQLTHLLTEVAARKHPHSLSRRERRRLDAAERAYQVRGDAAAAVGGASRRPPGRLWPQPFLRALSRLGGAAVADDATEPRRRRAHVRRLRRHHARGDRRIDRRGEDGAAVHRTLGASSYTYAEAIWTQGLSDWIGSHTRAFAFIGGAPAMVVSDNLRSGITKACFYEPAVNRTYGEMAARYDTAIVPARPYRACDKAKVEVAVQVATRFIIAKLRNRQFFSLSMLNAAVAELVARINNRASRHLGASRRALFEDPERSALKPLPAEPYVFAEWKDGLSSGFGDLCAHDVDRPTASRIPLPTRATSQFQSVSKRRFDPAPAIIDDTVTPMSRSMISGHQSHRA